MANKNCIKDWKKVVNDKDYTEWLNKDEFRWVGVNQIGSKYHVGGNRVTEKDFNTKAQAIKFAKNYMKQCKR